MKSLFYKKALYSPDPKKVWKIINSILHPPPRCIDASPDDLNNYFSTIAQKTLNKDPVPICNIQSFINNIKEKGECSFTLKSVSYNDVLNHLKALCNDCSTGADLIPIRYIKSITDQICSPLTHILNSFIVKDAYPTLWKISRVVPSNKITLPTKPSDYRPISILPALSKVYERIVLKQLLEFIEPHHLYKPTISGFRKGHSTTTALLKLRDDIKRAMSSGEITLLVLVDFSKAFDTLAYDKLIEKMDKQGFSKAFLNWTLSYLSNRSQFVHFDANFSKN